MSEGVVYLIGAGPGDPLLITVRGKELIETCDVIVYDYLANSKLLEWARPDAELIYVGKMGGDHTKTQKEINNIIVDRCKQGKKIARLKGGDPFIYADISLSLSPSPAMFSQSSGSLANNFAAVSLFGPPSGKGIAVMVLSKVISA